MAIIKILIHSVPGPILYVYRRQILTYKNSPHTERGNPCAAGILYIRFQANFRPIKMQPKFISNL